MIHSNGIRSEIELCLLNTARSWLQDNGLHCPIVSRFSLAELRSRLPFFTENEPVRFSRNKKKHNEDPILADAYAVKWMMRYNRLLLNGSMDAHKRNSEGYVQSE